MLRMLFPIYSIHPNPWQPRATEDTEHIEALAASILADGLLQEPVGRLCDASGEPKSVREVMTRINDPREIFEKLGWNVQLAFGHSRLAAYWLLHKRSDNGEWVELYICEQDGSNFEALWQLRTGSAEFNKNLVIRAMRLGLQYRAGYGIFRGEERIDDGTEAGIFTALGLKLVSPAERR